MQGGRGDEGFLIGIFDSHGKQPDQQHADQHAAGDFQGAGQPVGQQRQEHRQAHMFVPVHRQGRAQHRHPDKADGGDLVPPDQGFRQDIAEKDIGQNRDDHRHQQACGGDFHRAHPAFRALGLGQRLDPAKRKFGVLRLGMVHPSSPDPLAKRPLRRCTSTMWMRFRPFGIRDKVIFA